MGAAIPGIVAVYLQLNRGRNGMGSLFPAKTTPGLGARGPGFSPVTGGVPFAPTTAKRTGDIILASRIVGGGNLGEMK